MNAIRSSHGESRVTFNKPHFATETLRHMQKSIQSGRASGDGPYSKLAADAISRISGGPSVLLTPSCTHALELASLLLDLGPGDEVIMPSFTFTSAAISVVQFGAVPVFVDVRPDSMNIDVEEVLKAITSKTRAISFVNYAGYPADLRELRRISIEFNIPLVEDNAHGFGGAQDQQPLGSFGDFATLSFHETKNIQCGEGGALLINSAKYLERAEILREKGTNRSQFFRGMVDKYTWVDRGSSYLLADSLAAMLFANLVEFDSIQDSRRMVWRRYHNELHEWATTNNFRLPINVLDRENSAHMFQLVAPDGVTRDRFLRHLRDQDVEAVFHYQSLHRAPAGRKYGRTSGSLKISDFLSDCLTRLPMWAFMPKKDVDKVVSAVLRFRAS